MFSVRHSDVARNSDQIASGQFEENKQLEGLSIMKVSWDNKRRYLRLSFSTPQHSQNDHFCVVLSKTLDHS